MTKPTIDEVATQFAWDLGRSDYPSLDRCPYSAERSRRLHAAYWQGWRWAMRKQAVAERRPKSAA